jgi:hypothetical protein
MRKSRNCRSLPVCMQDLVPLALAFVDMQFEYLRTNFYTQIYTEQFHKYERCRQRNYCVILIKSMQFLYYLHRLFAIVGFLICIATYLLLSTLANTDRSDSVRTINLLAKLYRP